jgi:hypothetical protein
MLEELRIVDFQVAEGRLDIQQIPIEDGKRADKSKFSAKWTLRRSESILVHGAGQWHGDRALVNDGLQKHFPKALSTGPKVSARPNKQGNGSSNGSPPCEATPPGHPS